MVTVNNVNPLNASIPIVDAGGRPTLEFMLKWAQQAQMNADTGVVGPGDATKFLNGATVPAFAFVKDSDLSLTDVTANNVSTAKHGFTPKLPDDATKFLDGEGNFTVPAGGDASTYYAGLNTVSASVSTFSFATKGNIIKPRIGVSVTQLDTYIVGTPTVFFSIWSVTYNSGAGTYVINAEKYRSASGVSATGDTNSVINYLDTPATPVALTADTYYFICATGTSLALGTSVLQTPEVLGPLYAGLPCRTIRNHAAAGHNAIVGGAIAVNTVNGIAGATITQRSTLGAVVGISFTFTK